MECRLLVDTGCSVSLLDSRFARNLLLSGDSKELVLEIMNGDQIKTRGKVFIENVVMSNNANIGPIHAHIVNRLPLGLDVIIGLDVIKRNGLTIQPLEKNRSPIVLDANLTDPRSIQDSQERIFIAEEVAVPSTNTGVIKIDDKDFESKFCNKEWTVRWTWKDRPPPINSKRGNYKIPLEDKEEFSAELDLWIREGILVPWDVKRDGCVKNVLPLMSVRQVKGDKTKVRPVLDFRFLNEYILSFPGSATPLCQERLRQWRQVGNNCSVVDLRKAYLQIKIDPSLWSYQCVRWEGQIYVLTRLGFGLNIAPKVMTKIVERILSENEILRASTSNYIDDIFVNERFIPVENVVDVLSDFGLRTKPPERLGEQECVRVLGLQVDSNFNWRRSSTLPLISDCMTRREIHKVLGEWLGHYPVCGWLRVVCGYIQRLTAKEKLGWDEHAGQNIMTKVVEIAERLKTGDDPVKGKWLAPSDGNSVIWTDASNLAMGVVLTINGNVVEDAAWLRREKDAAHINISELDAAIRGVNLAIKWNIRSFILKTDSATVKGWLNSAFHDTHNIRTNALAEMIIRRRIQMLRDLRRQESLDVTIQLVRSAENLADKLTRVPRAWLQEKSENEHSVEIGAMASSVSQKETIRSIHNRNHLGITRTYHLAKERFGSGVDKEIVREVIQECDRCARICPVVQQYPKGSLGCCEVWKKLSCDITHVEGKPYLTVIDMGSRFTVWRTICSQTASEVIERFREIFADFGPPAFLLTDNGAVFRSGEFKRFMVEWGVHLQYSCAYRPQGNGISERNHRTVKTMRARSSNPVEECVFWYNTSNDHGKPSPYSLLFHANSRKPGVNRQREMNCESVHKWLTLQGNLDEINRENPYSVGELVYLRSPDGRCDSMWSGPHRVTSINSNVAVELDSDGVNRHIAHIKRVPRRHRRETVDSDSSDSDHGVSQTSEIHSRSSDRDNFESSGSDDEDTHDEAHEEDNSLRRGSRTRHHPSYLNDYFA